MQEGDCAQCVMNCEIVLVELHGFGEVMTSFVQQPLPEGLFRVSPPFVCRRGSWGLYRAEDTVQLIVRETLLVCDLCEAAVNYGQE